MARVLSALGRGPALAGVFGEPVTEAMIRADFEAGAFAEHLTAGYRVKTEGRGRTVDEWKLRPDRRDNHRLDGVVGCAVAASVLGCTLPNAQPGPKPAPERLTMREMDRLARAGRAKAEGWGWSGGARRLAKSAEVPRAEAG